jgi:drug/metabolite transporter (DMT)-like permease
MARKMKNYDVYLSSILLASLFNLVYWPVVWFRMFVTKQITPEMRKFPWYRFLIMGFLDCVTNTVQTLDASYVSGPINVVVGQMVILTNVILSYVFLGSRYNIMHIGGVLVVIVGVALDVLPCLLSINRSSQEINQWPWILILLLNAIPMAASNVYKERHLKKANLDIWYVQAWVMFWQWIFGLFIFPIVFLPLPKPYTSITIKELPGHLWNGMKCTVGINTLPGDQCDYFYLVLLVFLVFNLLFNYLMLYVFKYGSSTLAVVAGAARLALSNLGFLIPILAGEATQKKLSLIDIEALVILIVGIIVYSITREQRRQSYSLIQAMFTFIRKTRKFFRGRRRDEDYSAINEPTS